jgi:hypothetical protein
LYAIFTLFLSLAPGIIIPGCDLLNTSLTNYFWEHNEIVQVTGYTVKPGQVMTADGTIFIPPGDTTIGLILSNPRNFNVRQELAGVPAGKDIVALQISQTEIEVTIKGAEEGDGYELTLALQSPDGLRDFPSYPLRIRCVSFVTALQDFTVNGATPPTFDPAQGTFRVNVPYSNAAVALKGTTAHSGAAIAIYAGADDSGAPLATGTHTAETTQPLELGDNHFYLTITAPSSIRQSYAVTVHRAAASETAITDFFFVIGGKRYGAGTGSAYVAGSGSISGTAIAAIVPYGTDLTAMTASAPHTGASISPNPASPRSYVNPVVYTVTAEDGTKEIYTVTVMAAKIAAIGTISFADGFASAGLDISGDIKAAITKVTGTDSLGTAITTLAGEDYSVDALVPTEDLKGTSITATLRVPAAKGSAGEDITQDFTVYIKSGAKEMTAFAILTPASATGTVDEALKTVTATVPYGTDITAMTASATHSGALISPDPGSARDYSAPVDYTVTSEDGTTASYTVTVTVALNSAKAITAFTISTPVSAAGTIDEDLKTITVNVPYGTNVTAMTASASYTGASLGPAPGLATNYAAPVNYTVIAADGSQATYTVTVNLAPPLNSAKAITAFSILSPVSAAGSISGNNITATVPYGTDVTGMTASATHPDASISPDPGSAIDYSAPVVYTVTAEDGTTAVYTVTVTVTAVKIAAIGSINGNFTNPHGFANTGADISAAIKAAITSVEGTDSLGLAITLAAGDYSVDPLSPTAGDEGTAMTATLRVPADKSSTGGDITKNFTVYIKSGEKRITHFYFAIGGKNYGEGPGVESDSGSISGNSITANLPEGTNKGSLPSATVTLSHAGASIAPDPATVTDYASPVTYRVTAENGTFADYTVTVNVVVKAITISVTPVEALNTLIFDSLSSTVTGGTPIRIQEGVVDVFSDSWHIDISGPVNSSVGLSGMSAIVFTAPTTPGFYNVNVIAKVDGIHYSGSFGLTVD